MGTKVHEKDGFYFVSGSIDQASDFSAIRKAKPPLKLNLAGVSQINSLGIQKFMAFLSEWGDQDLEYHECSVSFLLAAALIPAIVQHPHRKDAVRVSSFYCPYRCEQCKATRDTLVNVADLRRVGDTFEPPQDVKCGCGKGKMVFDDEPEQYFQFLEN